MKRVHARKRVEQRARLLVGGRTGMVDLAAEPAVQFLEGHDGPRRTAGARLFQDQSAVTYALESPPSTRNVDAVM